ncbi:MAG: triose-phosphate isomerase [Spirochaetales bacterium]
MHKTVGEAVELAKDLVESLKGCPHKLMIAPPFTALSAVASVVKGSNILLGAQNMASVEQGAHTGEVSVLMLKDIGVQSVILGHSERRILYGEKNDLINEKVKLALKHGLEVVLCVGETLEEREQGRAEKVVTSQVTECLKGVGEGELPRITIAYEPVWAIGTGKNATPADADAIHSVIRMVLDSLYRTGVGETVTIQYGGSVKPENAKDLLTMPNIDGALVGGASLKRETFVPIAWFDR